MYIYNSLLNKIADIGAQFLVIEISGRLLSDQRSISSNEKRVLEEISKPDYSFANKKRAEFLTYYCPEYSSKDINELIKCRFTVAGLRKVNGIVEVIDCKSRFMNIINHSRLTTDIDNNKEYAKTIYLFGNCIAFGDFAEDKMTVASQLQRMFNDENLPYKVKNCSNGGNFLVSANLIISNKYYFTKDDIIIVITQGTDSNKGFNLEKYKSSLRTFLDESIFHYYNLSNIFVHPYPLNDAEIFFDHYHMNHRGYFIVAQRLSKIIKEIAENKKKEEVIPEQLKQYTEYLDFLRLKCPSPNGIIGSIAMNCNPFTLGHQYLIESALERCDFLYVFILDEDKSFFKFEDRFSLAKINTETYIKDHHKVCIIPSSKMIISNETFPEYFEKDKEFITIDTSKDLTIFCKYIAPKLGIKKRFVGDEPYCAVTNQYNQEMKKLLFLFDIEVVELKRLAINQEIVSATKVRAAIAAKDQTLVKKFISEKTYAYLHEKGYI